MGEHFAFPTNEIALVKIPSETGLNNNHALKQADIYTNFKL